MVVDGYATYPEYTQNCTIAVVGKPDDAVHATRRCLPNTAVIFCCCWLRSACTLPDRSVCYLACVLRTLHISLL